VDETGTGINGAALKEAIRRGQIITVHRGTDGTHPTLVVEKVEDPADAGSSLTLDALKDVTAPASTAAGMFLGTTGVGAWGPVANPTAGVWAGKSRTSRPNQSDRLVEFWDGTAWIAVHYDSGWRLLSSWDTSGAVTGMALAAGAVPKPAAAGWVRLRRIGTTVHVAFTNVNLGPGVAAIYGAGTIPAGFLCNGAGNNTVGLAMVSGTGKTGALASAISSTGLSILQTSGQTFDVGAAPSVGSYLTADVLPATLLGTTYTVAP
jgi:hypothetical protein